MNIRIHRGAAQIGGTCIEVESAGRRIVLDAGMPMGEVPRMSELLPDVPGLWARGDGSLLALIVSHGHPDHLGLADLVDPQVPVFLGVKAAAVCREMRFFVPVALDVGSTWDLVDGCPVVLGPFTITPFAVDHGIDDAFALLIEADGRRLLYSGDLRGHGRDPNHLERLAERVGAVDTLLLEGTRLGSNPLIDPTTEAEVEERCAQLFSAAPKAVLAMSSSTNLDRIDTIARAARRAGRTPVLDLYGASVWSAAGRPWPCEARVRLPHWQRRRIIETGAFDRTHAVRRHRIYDDELCLRQRELVLITRSSSLPELESLGVLLDAEVVWSSWAGYVDETVLRVLRRNGAGLHHAHASGHAHPRDLRRLVEALQPREVVPVHTERPLDMAAVLGRSTEQHADGEWFAA